MPVGTITLPQRPCLRQPSNSSGKIISHRGSWLHHWQKKKKESVRTSFILHSQSSPCCRYDETQITLTHPPHAAKDAQSSKTLIRLHWELVSLKTAGIVGLLLLYSPAVWKLQNIAALIGRDSCDVFVVIVSYSIINFLCCLWPRCREVPTCLTESNCAEGCKSESFSPPQLLADHYVLWILRRLFRLKAEGPGQLVLNRLSKIWLGV